MTIPVEDGDVEARRILVAEVDGVKEQALLERLNASRADGMLQSVPPRGR